MELGKLGVCCFTDPLTPAQLTELAQQTERLGYSALWYPEALSYESFSLGSFLLHETKTLIIATGIANIYARDATTAKWGQHTLAKLSGGRFLLGLGVSHVPLVEDLRGHRSGEPLATMRAYLDAMDKAAATAPPLEDPPPTVLAALGPGMTVLAAARAAGARGRGRQFGALPGRHRKGGGPPAATRGPATHGASSVRPRNDRTGRRSDSW